MTQAKLVATAGNQRSGTEGDASAPSESAVAKSDETRNPPVIIRDMPRVLCSSSLMGELACPQRGDWAFFPWA
jgi:hypothetical protein